MENSDIEEVSSILNMKTENVEEDPFFLVFAEDPADSNVNDLIVYAYDPFSGRNRTNGRVKYRQYAKFLFTQKDETMIIGGQQYGDAQICLDNFHACSRIISHLAPMKRPRSGAGAALLNSNIVVCGGSNEGTPTDSCEIYLSAEDRWCLLPSMNMARSLPGVAIIGQDKVFVIGGWGQIKGVRTRFSSIEMCQIPNYFVTSPPNCENFWKFLAPMHEKRNEPSVGVLDRKIFVTGGHDGESFLVSTEMFLPPEEKIPLGQWIRLASIQNTTRVFCIIAAKGRLYAFGAKEHPGDTILRFEPEDSKTNVSELHDESGVEDFGSWNWTPLPALTKLNYIHGVSKVAKSLLPLVDGAS